MRGAWLPICLFAGCGGQPTTPASAPPVASSAPSTPALPPGSSTPAPASPSAASTTPAGPCTGADLDLGVVLMKAECRATGGPVPPMPTSGLEVRLMPSAESVAPGGSVTLTLEIRNVGTAPANVAAMIDLLTHPMVMVKDASNATLAPPAGTPNVSTPKYCTTVDCAFTHGHAMVSPGGKGTWKVPWRATKLAWPKGTVEKGCCDLVAVDPVEVGPLPAGTYALRLSLSTLTATTIVKVGP